jgi:hypothetical protein
LLKIERTLFDRTYKTPPLPKLIVENELLNNSKKLAFEIKIIPPQYSSEHSATKTEEILEFAILKIKLDEPLIPITPPFK